MNHTKTVILILLALMSSLSISSISADTNDGKVRKESKTTTKSQEEIDGLVAVISKGHRGSKGHQEAKDKLVNLVTADKYTPDLRILNAIVPMLQKMFEPEYKALKVLERYDKVFPQDQGGYTLDKETRQILVSLISRMCSTDKGYAEKVLKKAYGIITKNLPHFTGEELMDRLFELRLDGTTFAKILRHIIDLIKTQKYKPNIDDVKTLLSCEELSRDQAAYILEYAKSNHNDKDGFAVCMGLCLETCYKNSDFLLGLLEDIDKSCCGDGSQQNTNLILHILDLFTTGRAAITCSTHKIHKRAQDLLIKHLDKLTPDKLAFALTARYLDDKVGKKVARFFVNKISQGAYKPDYTDLLYALHSRYLSDKQRDIIIDTLIKTYDGKTDLIDKYFQRLDCNHDLLRKRLHGYNSHKGPRSGFKDWPPLSHWHIFMCNSRFMTGAQLQKSLDFLGRNCQTRDLLESYLWAQHCNMHVTDRQVRHLFDRILAEKETVWYVALHRSATDDQRLKAMGQIMSRGETADFLKASLQKLKKPLRDRCGAGDKCTEGKGPCCLASIKKYSAYFEKHPEEDANYKPAYTNPVVYKKFDGIARWPLEDKFVRPQEPSISSEDLAKYLSDIDNLDLHILCRIMRYSKLDQAAKKKVLEKVKLLERYLGPEDIGLLLSSRYVPKSYKKKLVKQMMENRFGSRDLVACQETSHKDVPHIFKYCNDYCFLTWLCAPYFGGYDGAMFDDPGLYAPYADKYMSLLQIWIDQGDPEQSGESLYMQSCIGTGWACDLNRDAYCGCNDVLCELTALLRQGDLPVPQRDRLFRYLCYYLDRFIYFTLNMKYCEYYYCDCAGWALPAMHRLNDILCHKFTDEQFTELFKIIGKYADKFAPEDLTSYLASDIINQACKDILWKAMGNKGVVLPPEAVKFLRENGVEVRSQQG